VVKDEDLCEGKVLECNHGTRKLLFKKEEGSATCEAEFSRELCIEKMEVLPDVEINGLRKESKLYCIGAIPTTARFSFLLNNQRNFDLSLFVSLTKKR